jgi:hypothetical protein
MIERSAFAPSGSAPLMNLSTRYRKGIGHKVEDGYQWHRLSDSVREKVYTTSLTDTSLPRRFKRRAGKGPAEIGTRSSGGAVMRLGVDRLICYREVQ